MTRLFVTAVMILLLTCMLTGEGITSAAGTSCGASPMVIYATNATASYSHGIPSSKVSLATTVAVGDTILVATLGIGDGSEVNTTNVSDSAGDVFVPVTAHYFGGVLADSLTADMNWTAAEDVHASGPEHVFVNLSAGDNIGIVSVIVVSGVATTSIGNVTTAASKASGSAYDITTGSAGSMAFDMVVLPYNAGTITTISPFNVTTGTSFNYGVYSNGAVYNSTVVAAGSHADTITDSGGKTTYHSGIEVLCFSGGGAPPITGNNCNLVGWPVTIVGCVFTVLDAAAIGVIIVVSALGINLFRKHRGE
jgi:hypothetical protein